METFIQLVVNGLGKGAVYALLALGFVMIYKATEVVNFALGSLVLVGGYLVYVLRDAIGWYAAAAAGIVGAALAGLLMERLLAGARGADQNSLALLTIGVDVIIAEEIVRRVGAAIPFIGDPFDAHPIQIGTVAIFRTQAIALVVGLVLITAFFVAFRYTDWGVAMRAQAENREAAALMGIGAVHGDPGLLRRGAGPWHARHRADRVPRRDHRRPGLDGRCGCRGDHRGAHRGAVGAVHLLRLLQERRVPRDARRARGPTVRAVRHEGAHPCLTP